jgi:hypothetical protein
MAERRRIVISNCPTSSRNGMAQPWGVPFHPCLGPSATGSLPEHPRNRLISGMSSSCDRDNSRLVGHRRTPAIFFGKVCRNICHGLLGRKSVAERQKRWCQKFRGLGRRTPLSVSWSRRAAISSNRSAKRAPPVRIHRQPNRVWSAGPARRKTRRTNSAWTIGRRPRRWEVPRSG